MAFFGQWWKQASQLVQWPCHFGRPSSKVMFCNGQTLTRRYITHRELTEGGVIEFEMTAKPVRRTAQRELPYSLSAE